MQITDLLILHSYYRWLVLFVMLVQIVWLWLGYRSNKAFTLLDFYFLISCTIVYDVQLVVGWLLYIESPIVQSFWSDFGLGVKQRQMRFFGMEHVTMMTLGIFLVNMYTIITAKKHYSQQTFKYLWKRYLWIYFIILTSIPWSFSPLTSRPNFR